MIGRVMGVYNALSEGVRRYIVFTARVMVLT